MIFSVSICSLSSGNNINKFTFRSTYRIIKMHDVSIVSYDQWKTNHQSWYLRYYNYNFQNHFWFSMNPTQNMYFVILYHILKLLTFKVCHSQKEYDLFCYWHDLSFSGSKKYSNNHIFLLVYFQEFPSIRPFKASPPPPPLGRQHLFFYLIPSPNFYFKSNSTEDSSKKPNPYLFKISQVFINLPIYQYRKLCVHSQKYGTTLEASIIFVRRMVDAMPCIIHFLVIFCNWLFCRI